MGVKQVIMFFPNRSEVDRPRTTSPAWKVVFVATVVLLMLPSFARGDRGVDTVTLADGTTIRGRVGNASPEEIVLKPQGEEQEKKLALDEILSIRFGGEPASLGALRDQIRNGEWDAARQSLNRMKEVPDDPLIRSDVEFYKAYVPALEALKSGAGHKEAAGKLYSFAQKQKLTSYHYPEALKVLGALALQLRSYDVARKQFLELQATQSPSYQLWGILGEAEALEQQGVDKYPAAAAILAKAKSVQGSGVQVERLRSIALARKWAMQGVGAETTKAIAEIEKLIQEGDSKDAPLFAELYNALGMVRQAAGMDEDALCDFLHVDLIYSGERDAHAKALAHIAELFQKLSQPERSQEARKRLMASYPGSVWTKNLAAE
jgi:tetratricopeptide (TPR) repeat protein